MLRVIAVLFTAALVFAQDPARMDAVVRDSYDKKEFSGSVLVTKEGQTIFEKSYGMANLEWQIPNDATTKFRLGSITKQFTAVSLLLLEERGKLSINDPVNKYLPKPVPAWERITIKQVLNHTSGIPSFTNFPEYPKLKLNKSTPEELIKLSVDKPLEFDPGTKYKYSNSGYVLLTYILERVSGQSYADFLQQNIFKPLGMTDTGYDSHAAVIPKRAAGYVPTPKGIENAEYIDMSVPQGAGGLYSTTRDLNKWALGIAAGKLLNEDSVNKLTTPALNNYALGLVVTNKNGRRRINHNGGIDGFNTSLTYYPEERIFITVLSNLNGPGAGNIDRNLSKVVFGEPVVLTSERKEITVAPEKLAAYSGVYQLRPGFDLTITVEDGKLMAQATNQPKFPLFASAEDKFFLKVVDAQIDFAPGQLTLHQNGADIKGVKK